MTQRERTPTQIQSDIEIVRNEIGSGANSAARIAQLVEDISNNGQPASNTAYLAQTAWFLSSTGNDTADGQQASPLMTVKQLNRRIWCTAGQLAAVTTITFAGNHPGGALTVQVAPNSPLVLTGTPTVLATDTCGTYTNASSGTNRYVLLTGTTITDWTPYVGKRLRITVGTYAGAVSWVMAVTPFGLGVATAKITVPTQEPTALNGWVVTGNTVLSSGNTVVVESLPVIDQQLVDVLSSNDDTLLAAAVPSLVVKNLTLTKWSHRVSGGLSSAMFWGCKTGALSCPGATQETLLFVGCLLSSPSSKLVGASYYHCGVLKPSGSGLSQYQLSTLADFNHMTFEGVGLLVKGAQATFTNLNIDNASGTGLEVGSGGRFIATNTGLSGQGNNGFGVSVEKISGYLEIWSSGTSITGTSGAWAFSFVLAMAWTDAPRCYGRGRTSAQALSSGIASFTIPDLPPTANFSPAYAVPKSGVTGVLYPANAATSTVEVRSSDLTDSTSTVTIGWESGQNGMVAKHAT